MDPSEIVDRHIFILKNSIPKECTRKNALPNVAAVFLNDFTVARTKKIVKPIWTAYFPTGKEEASNETSRTIIADFSRAIWLVRRYPKDAGYFKALLEELQVDRKSSPIFNKGAWRGRS